VQNLKFVFSKSVLLCILLLSTLLSGQEALEFFVPRTLFVHTADNIGGIWSNAASLAEQRNIVLQTENASPIARRFTYSFSRIVVPVSALYTIAVELSGASGEQTGSFRSRGSGVNHTSFFTFENPQLAFAAAGPTPIRMLKSGFLLAIGTGTDTTLDGSIENYPVISTGIGVAAPSIFSTVSLASQVVYRSFFKPDTKYEEISGSVAVSAAFLAERIKITIDGAASSIGSAKLDYYAVKSLLWAGSPQAVNAIFGFSKDSPTSYSSATLTHLGAGIRQKSDLPFWGIFDMGIGAFTTWEILYHFQVSYELASNRNN